MAKNVTSPGPKADDAKVTADKAVATPGGGDKKTSGRDAVAAGLSDAGMITVTCLVAAGRRRGGRRWPAGPTEVDIDDLSDEGWAAVRADPMLSVSMPHAAEG